MIRKRVSNKKGRSKERMKERKECVVKEVYAEVAASENCRAYY